MRSARIIRRERSPDFAHAPSGPRVHHFTPRRVPCPWPRRARTPLPRTQAPRGAGLLRQWRAARRTGQSGELLPLAGNGPDVFLCARHCPLSRRQSRRVADRAFAARGDELGAPGRLDHRPAKSAGVSLGGSRRGRADHHHRKVRRSPQRIRLYRDDAAPQARHRDPRQPRQAVSQRSRPPDPARARSVPTASSLTCGWPCCAHRSSGRRRTVVFAHPQLAHRQLVHFERLEARLLDRYAADDEPADRQRPDRDSSERSRADRKRDHAGGGNGFGSADDITRHRWVSVRQLVFVGGGGEGRTGAPLSISDVSRTNRNALPDGGGAIPIWRYSTEYVFSRRVNIGPGSRHGVTKTGMATLIAREVRPWRSYTFSWGRTRSACVRRCAASVWRTSKTRWHAGSPIFRPYRPTRCSCA